MELLDIKIIALNKSIELMKKERDATINTKSTISASTDYASMLKRRKLIMDRLNMLEKGETTLLMCEYFEQLKKFDTDNNIEWKDRNYEYRGPLYDGGYNFNGEQNKQSLEYQEQLFSRLYSSTAKELSANQIIKSSTQE